MTNICLNQNAFSAYSKVSQHYTLHITENNSVKLIQLAMAATFNLFVRKTRSRRIISRISYFQNMVS